MIIGIVILLLAFTWLMWETKFFSIRLRTHHKRFIRIVKARFDSFNAIIQLTPMLVNIGFIVGALVSGFFGVKEKVIEELSIWQRLLNRIKGIKIINPIPVLFAAMSTIIIYPLLKSIDSIQPSFIDETGYILKSPTGNYYGYFTKVEAKRICRKHQGWEYDYDD